MLSLLQPIVHYSLHFLAPGLIAWLLWPAQRRRAWLIMLATMAVDLDHLWAYPEIFVPDRCSINFHPLHTWWAMIIYAIGLGFKPTRIIATGLLFHMFTDWQDCQWTMWLSALRG